MTTDRDNPGGRRRETAGTDGPDATLRRALPAAPAPSAAELDALFARVEGAVRSERGWRAWLRDRPTAVRWLLAAALVAGLGGASALLTRRADWAVYPSFPMVATLVALGALVIGALALGLRPLHRPAAPRWLTAGVLALGVAAPVVLAALPQVHAAHPASLAGAGADFAARAFACFGFGAVLAVPVVLLLLLLDRGGHLALRRALAAAVAAGLAANLALQVHCPITHPAHLLAGHASLALAVPLAYGLLSRLVARRARGAIGPQGWPEFR